MDDEDLMDGQDSEDLSQEDLGSGQVEGGAVPVPMASVPVPVPMASAPADVPAPPIRVTSPVTIAPRMTQSPDSQSAAYQAQINNALWNRLRSRLGSSPIAQAENSVAIALKFLAIRQYQRDLQSGMDPSRALARSAPLMFTAPRSSTLGQAAQMVRAASPTPAKLINVNGVLYRQNADNSVTALSAPRARRYNVGGVLYQEGEGGKMVPLTQPRPVQPKTDPFDLAEYNSTLRQIAQVQHDSQDDRIGSPVFNQHQATLGILEGKLKDIRRRTPAASSIATAPANAARVRVRAPSGKFGTVPDSQLQSAIRQGYTQIK